MTASFIQIITWLVISVLLIVVLTAKYRLHPFFILVGSCFVVGLGVQMPVAEVLNTIKEGFGNILKSLGLIIIMGTTLGVILERTGSTEQMALYILKKTGERRAALAVSITGFIVGLPVFCDSGFIVLSGLNHSIAKRTGLPITVMAVSMATGLYSVHCMIPPHPGATAAAVTLGADIGRLILLGIVISIPAAISGYFWSVYAGRKTALNKAELLNDVTIKKNYPSVVKSFLPILVPVLLIALKSFFSLDNKLPNTLQGILNIAGDPAIALAAGVLLASLNLNTTVKVSFPSMLQEAAEKAGSILVIIGAGGAFGAVLAATKIGTHFSTMSLSGMGLLFPFLLASVLKTAQGSSTVAIITAASIIKPLLPVLGLATANGAILCVLSMGAGSMMISHANDAYFWVISRFSGLEMKPMLRIYSVATIFMGITSFLMVCLLSLFL